MIKHILFDFGAVLIPIDEERTHDALDQLGALPKLRYQEKHFQQYETGKLSTPEFINGIKPFFFRKKIFSGDLEVAWNALLHEPLQEDVINLLKRLKSNGFKLYLISNTNELHIRQIRRAAGPFKYRQFIRQFEEIYFSHEVGLRKPDKAIFEKVLKDHKLAPRECLFIDDKKENVAAAAKLKLKTWHYNPRSEDILDLPRRLEKWVRPNPKAVPDKAR